MADRIYPVLQLTLPFIRDSQRLRDVFRSLDYPEDKIKWIVNRHRKDGEFSTDDLKKALDVRDLITLSSHYEAVASSVNQGVPVDQVAPGSPVTRALRDLARGLLPPPPPPPPHAGSRWLTGLFGATAS
jgi:pilus assembly protein CpaE